MPLTVGPTTTFRTLLLRLKDWVDGFGAIGNALLDTATAASARTVLGAGANGAAVFQTGTAASGRTVLGLGTAALKNTGTSGDAVPLLNANNEWWGTNLHTAQSTFYTSTAYGLVARFEGADASAGGPVVQIVHNSASPAAADSSFLQFKFNNSGGSEIAYGTIQAYLADPTVGSEDFQLRFGGYIAGADSALVRMGPGLQIGGPTGGMPAQGYANAVGYQRGGVATGWKLLATLDTSSGATQAATGLSASDAIMLVWDGVSHNGGANRTFRVEISDDNGSTYGTARTVSASVAAGSAMHGIVTIFGTGVAGQTKVIAPDIGIAGATVGQRSIVTEGTETGVTNAIRVSPSADSFGAGTVYIYGAS